MTDGNIVDFSDESRSATISVNMLIPAAILFLVGLAVTFTQTFHENLTFNSWLVAAFGVIYGLALLASALPALGGTRSTSTLIVAGASIVVGIAAPVMTSTGGLAVLLLAWASVTTLTQIWRWAQTRERDALVVGLFAALLSVILAFGARELPAVIGFFAAYCIIVGVYLGIASFDRTARADASEVV